MFCTNLLSRKKIPRIQKILLSGLFQNDFREISLKLNVMEEIFEEFIFVN